MEFKLSTDLAKVESLVVNFNSEEIKQYLSEQLVKYRGLVVTEETLPSAKQSLATLRRLADAMNDEKIRVKKSFMAPYTDFENKVKELLAMIKEPVQEIDAQIKELDEKRRNEKLEVFRQYWLEHAGRTAEFCPWESMCDPRWGNVTAKEADVHKTIDERITMCNYELGAISNLDPTGEVTDLLLDRYKLTHDMSDVVRHYNMLRARQEASKARAEEQDSLRPEVDANSTDEPITVDTEPNMRTYTLQLQICDATREQLVALKDFMVNNNIKFKSIK